MSSDEEVISVRKKKNVIQSDDSEDEILSHDRRVNIMFTEEDEVRKNAIKIKKKTIRLKTFESSSDTDEDTDEKSITTGAKNTNITLSESLSTVEKFDRSQDENGQMETKKESFWYKNDDLYEEDKENNKNTLVDQQKGKNLNKQSWYQNNEDLFGDESSEDETKHSQENNQSDMDEEDMDGGSITKPMVAPKERASKKKAMNEIQEIQKESQRMMRQSNVSIPYHRPRQRSLAEFRARRTTVPSVSLRTSSDKLVSAWKAIEQREKEAATFYKSESSEEESESEEIEQSTDVTEKEKSIKMTNNLNENNNPPNLGEVLLVDSKGNGTYNTSEDGEGSVLRDLDIEKSALNPDVDEKHDESSVATNIVEGVTLITESLESEERGKGDTYVNSTEPSRGEVEKNCTDYTNTESEQYSLKYSESEIHLENDTDGNYLNGNKTSSIEVKVSKSGDDDNSLVRDSNVKSNMANSEEFSLRMSESQSELDISSQQKHNAVEINKTPKSIASSETGMLDSNEGTKTCMEMNNSESEIECSKFNSNNSLNTNVIISETNNTNKTDTDTSPISLQKDCLEDKLRGPLNGLNDVDSCESKFGKKYNLNLLNTLSDAPKMTGFDGEEIVLDEEVAKPGVDNLIERFFTHLSYKKKPSKKKAPLELSVISAETDSAGHVSAINKDVVQVMVGNEEEEEDPALAKPGAKLARLRAHLQAEMERQRQQEWEKKQHDQKLYEEEIYEGEKDICDAEEENEQEQDSVKESEDDPSEEEEQEEEDEEESDAETESGKQKNKSAFIDDEAEESIDDDCMDKDEEDSSNSFIKRQSKKKIVLKRTKTEDMFLSQEGIKSSITTEEEDWPSFQKPCEEGKIEEEESYSPICPSPAFRLTALEGKDVTRTNWSGPPTPCKDFISPKTVTPVRSGSLMSIVEKSPSVSSQDLENLCSGRFSTQPAHDIEENASQDFQLFLADDSQISQDQETTLDSPLVKTKSADGKDHMRSLMIDDDDDDDDLAKSIVTKKAKKLNFSDDEDEHDEDNQQLLEDDSEGSDVEEETAAGEPDTAVDDIEYDSEENEVLKAAGDFLDKEAELSESEWGSEDEDEHGLDILDTEEADKEKIDERRLQQQLGQIHMKQLLIEDKEKVRRLQELLLDDGELHSDNHRQKLFRWSNNITFGEDKPSIDSDEDKVEEDEDEESWRKERHAREQFLSEYSKKAGNLELAEDECFNSKLFQLGQKNLRRLQKSNPTPPAIKTSGTVVSPDPKRPFCSMMNMKRGSFLSRGQQVLARLAQIVSNSDGPIKQPTNSRNFVFASISPTKDKGEEEVKPLQTNKRKIPVLPLPVAKRPCVQKPKIANKKSLFEALAKVQS